MQHHLDEAHGSLVIARTEALLLPENCAEELADAIDCVESAIEQTTTPNTGTQRPGIAEATNATAADMPGSLQ